MPKRSKADGGNVSAFREVAKLKGCRLYRVHAGQTTAGGYYVISNEKGTPDLMGFLPDGRFLAIEAKAPGGKLRKEQAAAIASIREAGGLAFGCDSSQKLAALLDALIAGYRPPLEAGLMA